MPGPNVRLKINGPNVVDLRPGGLPVDGTLVQLAVLAGGGVDGVDVDHRHLLVQYLNNSFFIITQKTDL